MSIKLNSNSHVIGPGMLLSLLWVEGMCRTDFTLSLIIIEEDGTWCEESLSQSL